MQLPVATTADAKTSNRLANMRVETSYEVVRRIESWVQSLPQKKITYILSEEAKSENYYSDYTVDYEIRIIPDNKKSLGITIWLSEGAIGFFFESYAAVAKLLNCRVRRHQRNLACGGTEPVRSIDGEGIIKICKQLGNAEIEFRALKSFGYLTGIFSDVELNAGGVLHSAVGQSQMIAQLISTIGVAQLVRVPYEAW